MSTETNANPAPDSTPREKFETLAKLLVAVPKSKVDAAQKEWKKTKHKRGSTPSVS